MIAIIDYGMGNLRSVAKALELLGYETDITKDAKHIADADHVILPGVGAFGAAMENLKKSNLIDIIKNTANSGKPFMGICLGMQLLLDESSEMGRFEGLGIISGKVVNFFQPQDVNPQTQSLKIPHMGWNSVHIEKSAPFLKDVSDNSMVYFVHSYYVVPKEDVTALTCVHGIPFCAAVWKDNIFATQFHPEKSGNIGLKMLKNFAEAK